MPASVVDDDEQADARRPSAEPARMPKRLTGFDLQRGLGIDDGVVSQPNSHDHHVVTTILGHVLAAKVTVLLRGQSERVAPAPRCSHLT
jgi:hypothetical protein